MSVVLRFSLTSGLFSAIRRFPRYWLLVVTLGAGCSSSFGRNSGLDPGMDPKSYLDFISSFQGEFPLVWFRTRGVAGSEAEGDHFPRTLQSDRVALRELRKRGLKTVVIVRFPSGVWKQGVRPGAGHRLPRDLREVFIRMGTLAEAYVDLVDYWEIENEPDIAFVADNPEVYASFLKACFIAIRSARARAAPEAFVSPRTLHKSGRSWPQKLGSRSSQVMMAPLALPPGPYLERLWENEFFAYTDAINFHYYGYAEDFSGVYRQFESAFEDLVRDPGDKRLSKEVPVVLTEYGYGLLDETARSNEEGRARQRRWYESVRSQMNELRPAGTMAFTLRPYFEGNLNEFGLLLSPVGEPVNPETATTKKDRGFAIQPGRSPALNYLLAEREAPRARNWRLPKKASSPIVIDFIPESDLAQLKSYGGYLAIAGSGERRTGSGSFVIYNFSEDVVRGRLEVKAADGANVDITPAGDVEIQPFDRQVVGARISVPWRKFDTYRIEAQFNDPRKGSVSANYVFSVFPNAAGMKRSTTNLIGIVDDNSPNRLALKTRRFAAEEPELFESGKWLVSEGVEVTEKDGVWAFTIRQFPPYPLRPAVAELALPSRIGISSSEMLLLEHKIEVLSHDIGVIPGAMHQGTRTGSQGDMFDVYIRTANGNLYGNGGRFRPGSAWKAESIHNRELTMAFWGRAAMPWRFRDNRAVSLVFFIRPKALPAVLKIRNLEIVHWGALRL